MLYAIKFKSNLLLQSHFKILNYLDLELEETLQPIFFWIDHKYET